MNIAIAVIHGLGCEDKHFSVELKQLITEQYIGKGNSGYQEEDLIFQEVYWGDLLQQEQQHLLQKTNYKNDLTYMNLRQLFIDYLGTSIAYRNHEGELYKAVHERIANNLQALSRHRRVDAETTPLVILAHAHGSVIMSNYIHDIRTECSGKVVKNLTEMRTLAGFITFGSPLAIYALQNGEFETPVDVAGSVLDKNLQAKAKWLNFYDKDDIIAYPLKGLNNAYDQAVAEDIEINVGSAATFWNPACHDGYWEDKDFIIPVANYLKGLQTLEE